MSIHTNSNESNGRAAVFQDLHSRYHERLLNGITARFRDRELAEDVAASAFATAYEKFETFRGESSFYTWIFTIAMNVAKKRATQRTTSLEDFLRYQPESLREPDTVADSLHREDCRTKLRAALREVPAVYRQILVDHIVRSYPVRQIARRRGLPLGTVLSRISRAKTHLRAAWGV